MPKAIVKHLLTSARFAPSPNLSQRPTNEISLIVVHSISLPPEEFGGNSIEEFFCNTLDCSTHPSFANLVNFKVSAHLLIKRDGSCLQFVPFDQKAWHAGLSNYRGRESCNDFSIGIELEGSDKTYYTEVQYRALNAIIKTLKKHYPIIDVVGHSDIAPQRKTDPGPYFDWSRIGGN